MRIVVPGTGGSFGFNSASYVLNQHLEFQVVVLDSTLHRQMGEPRGPDREPRYQFVQGLINNHAKQADAIMDFATASRVVRFISDPGHVVTLTSRSSWCS